MSRTYGQLKEIVIKLTPEQKFWREIETDCSLLLVDEIVIGHEAEQVTLSGTRFEVDYDTSEICKNRHRTSLLFSTSFDTQYSDEEE